jgi:flagellar protein FliS
MSIAANAYKKTEIVTSVSSASTNELILLIYDRILENLRLGKKELENNRLGIDEFTVANELINLGLLASLNDQKGGEIAQNLRNIYLWAMHSIIEARLTKSSEKIDEIINVLNNLRQAWEFIKSPMVDKIPIQGN